MTRNLPTKDAILKYHIAAAEIWAIDEMTDINCCWGCGYTGNTERCHIQARSDGGSDECSNLILLCATCHSLQELECATPDGRAQFVSRLQDSAPYMQLITQWGLDRVNAIGGING